MALWRERAHQWGYRSMGAFPLRLRGNTVGAIAIYAHEPGLFDSENVALLDELAEDVSFAMESMEAQKMHRLAVDELDQFFALSLDMLCIVGMDGYIRRLNPAWVKTLGFTAGELRARPMIDFVHQDDRADALAALRTLQSGAALDQLEIRCLSKDGTYKWLIGSVVPVVGRGVFLRRGARYQRPQAPGRAVARPECGAGTAEPHRRGGQPDEKRVCGKHVARVALTA